MRHSDEMLLWGLRDGEMHFIDDVENGLACNCICPCCTEPLVARNKGEIRTHSFAHCSGADCLGAIESAVHKLAKQVLAQTKKLLLPPCFGNGPSGLKKYISEAKIEFEEVELEKSVIVNDIYIRPDAIGKFGGKELYIEFLFTHSVDQHKTALIKQKKVSCLEITLYPELQEPGKMKKLLLESVESKHWIYHKALERLVEQDFLLEKERQKEIAKREEFERKALETKHREYLKELELLEKEQAKEKDEWLRKASAKGNLYTACPVADEFLNYFRRTKWGNNEIIQKLEKGVWNMRRIYNNWPSEPIDMFIDGKQHILRPKKDIYERLPIKHRQYFDYLLESVKRYSRLLDIVQDNPCAHCKMFVQRKYEHIVCKYEKGMDVGTCLDFNSI